MMDCSDLVYECCWCCLMVVVQFRYWVQLDMDALGDVVYLEGVSGIDG